jgi:hypothetical protein
VVGVRFAVAVFSGRLRIQVRRSGTAATKIKLAHGTVIKGVYLEAVKGQNMQFRLRVDLRKGKLERLKHFWLEILSVRFFKQVFALDMASRVNRKPLHDIAD